MRCRFIYPKNFNNLEPAYKLTNYASLRSVGRAIGPVAMSEKFLVAQMALTTRVLFFNA